MRPGRAVGIVVSAVGAAVLGMYLFLGSCGSPTPPPGSSWGTTICPDPGFLAWLGSFAIVLVVGGVVLVVRDWCAGRSPYVRDLEGAALRTVVLFGVALVLLILVLALWPRAS